MSSGETPDQQLGTPRTKQPITGFAKPSSAGLAKPPRVASALRIPPTWFVGVLLFGFASAVLLQVVSRTQLRGQPLFGMLLELVVVTVGLLATLAGAGWGSAVAFQRSSQDGLWYVLFPPYPLIYAFRHWREAWQPTLLFVWGCSLIIMGLLAMLSLRDQLRLA